MGFKGRASTWYRDVEGGLQVFDLQRSIYGPQYYVNLCCVPAGMEVDGMPRPKEYKCPIRARLGKVCPELGKDVDMLLDLGNAIEEESREARLTAMIKNNVIPFFERIRTPDALRLAVAGRMKGLAVTLAAYKYLGITPDFGR